MSATAARNPSAWTAAAVPIGLLALVAVLVVPLPSPILDLLICGNIAVSALVLLAAARLRRALDFTAFPALLLATTLVRLVINVASTRLILSIDAPSPAAAEGAAGRVIEAFASLVAGENAVVGAVIFLILVVVQFTVVTKGATRMSEVAARFTLDALPGRQMAVDADLAAGAIDGETARVRRDAIAREAEFHGAMDGASRFVRGDAIAGLLIVAVNVIGGFLIAKLQLGWGWADAVRTFTLLAIGDGLAAQIPAFLVATASALVLARAGDGTSVGEELPRQLLAEPAPLWLIAGLLATLALVGLPATPLLAAAAIVATLALAAGRAPRDADAEPEPPSEAAPAADPESLLAVDTLSIEIGFALVPLVTGSDAARGGDLLARIGAIRRDLAEELGLIVPPVRIRDDLSMPPEAFRIRLRGHPVAEGSARPDAALASETGVSPPLEVALADLGESRAARTVDPATGLPAAWIDPAKADAAASAGLAVSDAAGAIAGRLASTVRRHAAELLTREETAALLERLAERSPRLVAEAVPAVVKPGELRKVLQALLREGVPVRDLETILETVADRIELTRDPDVLVEFVRQSLRRTICGRLAERAVRGGRPRIRVVTVDPEVEARLAAFVERGPAGTSIPVPASLCRSLAAAVSAAAAPLVDAGRPLVVLVAPDARAAVRTALGRTLPEAIALGYGEVDPECEVESVGTATLAAPSPTPTPRPEGEPLAA
jgi:flagellar biosynthesis protein FlhA